MKGNGDMGFIRLQSLLVITLAFFAAGAQAYAQNGVRLIGEMEQGGYVVGKAPPGASVMYNDEKLPLTEDRHFVFGFGRDEGESATLHFVYPDSTMQDVKMMIGQRDYEIQRIDSLPAKMVTPPEDVYERIASDQALVNKARSHKTKMPFFMEGFIVPVEGIITGVYGSQRILNGTPKQPHYGIDYAAETGTPVYAPAGGIVRLAHPDMYYTGGTLIIDHGFGLSSTLMHLNSVDVEEGQEVVQGEVVATVGSTGRSTGAHLDWRMNWNDVRIDPALVLKTSAQMNGDSRNETAEEVTGEGAE